MLYVHRLFWYVVILIETPFFTYYQVTYKISAWVQWEGLMNEYIWWIVPLSPHKNFPSFPCDWTATYLVSGPIAPLSGYSVGVKQLSNTWTSFV